MDLLASFDVRVYAGDEVSLPHPCGHLVHALALNLIREADASLAEQLHQPRKYQPFTASTLYGRGVRHRTPGAGGQGSPSIDQRTVTIPKYAEVRLRLTTLSFQVHEALSAALYQRLAARGNLTLGGSEFQLLDVFSEPNPERHSLGQIATYGDLLKAASPSDGVGLRFLSPTTFRQSGRNLPLPLPAQVFEGLARRWTFFSPVPLPAPVDDSFLPDLVVSSATLSTRFWHYPDYTLCGSVGWCTYRLLGKHTDEERSALALLADFAFFAGVGYKTTMGMGQCRRM